jgi:non-canonical (house-cleaning) NTP pyrophosphatase
MESKTARVSALDALDVVNAINSIDGIDLIVIEEVMAFMSNSRLTLINVDGSCMISISAGLEIDNSVINAVANLFIVTPDDAEAILRFAHRT